MGSWIAPSNLSWIKTHCAGYWVECTHTIDKQLPKQRGWW